MKKKILTLLALTFASITPLVACQKTEDNSNPSGGSTPSEPVLPEQPTTPTSVESVSIKNEGKVLNLSLDQGATSSGQIEHEVLPSSVDQSVTYISNDESIVTVAQNGKVFAHWKGTTTIKVTSTLDTTKFDTIMVNVSDTRDSLTRWSKLLQGSFQLKGVVEETDTLVTPSDDSELEAGATTYVVDRVEKRYSEGKKYNYDLDLWNVDFDAGETEADGTITEERLSIFNKDEDPKFADFDGSVQDTSLNQDNTIQRSFITYDWNKQCANPFKDFTKDDYKYTDDSKTSFTIADSHSDIFDDICTNLVYRMQNDPYTSLVFTEGDDRTLKAVIKDTVEEDSDDDGDWTYQLTATYKITAKDEEAFNVEPREETELSKKFDSVLDNMKNLESYTISHTDTYADGVTPPTDIPEKYDVKLLQHVNEKSIDYTIANYGTKKGVAKFKDNSYYQYNWDKDPADETKNIITKGNDVITDPESYRAQYVPKYDSISGTMFKEDENEKGSYTVDETNLYGINHHVRMFIFYYLLLEDYDSKMFTDYEPENLKIYLDETDSSKPVLKALTYDQMNKEDGTLVKHTRYDYKDLNSTTISDLDFSI